ncbi:MAG: hypothetical protein HY525_14110 [Betaproteobacteria bacterium]|nr:hypothetical protein [Betaproteobacteria bacterium]
METEMGNLVHRIVWLLLAVVGFLAAFNAIVYVFGLDTLDRTLVTGIGLIAGIALVWLVWYLIHSFPRS